MLVETISDFCEYPEETSSAAVKNRTRIIIFIRCEFVDALLQRDAMDRNLCDRLDHVVHVLP